MRYRQTGWVWWISESRAKHTHYIRFLKHPESNWGCMGRVPPLETIGIQADLSLFPTELSLRSPSLCSRLLHQTTTN